MTHTVVNRTSIRRNWIFTIIAAINIAAIAWVLFMGHIGVAIHEVVSYGDARELIHKGIIDVDALQELGARKYTRNLLVMTGNDLSVVRNQIYLTVNTIALILLLDVITLFLWRRGPRAT